MKRIVLILAFLVGGISSAAAVCTGPAVMHDFPGTSFNMSLATNAGDGNCASNVSVVGTPAVQGNGASGSALAGSPFRVGLSDGTNSQNWLAAIALADGVNGNNTGAMAPWVWNGLTYDRWYGDKTNGGWVNVKTSVLPTGASTSALQGTNTATTAHTCSVAGFSELGCLGQIDDDIKGPIAAGSAIIGKVGIDQTTPGTTNAVSATNFPSTVATGTGAQGATVPRVTVATDTATVAGSATLPAGTNTIGNTGFDPSSGKATPTEAFLALPATTTTQIIALSGSTKTYITSALVLAGGTVNVTFKYGTGVNCGTGTTTLNGPWPLTAQAGFSKGAGSGAVMIVPAGQALCITTDASVSGGVDLTYQQF